MVVVVVVVVGGGGSQALLEQAWGRAQSKSGAGGDRSDRELLRTPGP